ncbi:calcineurin-like phosphoesterase C-terminal domain-containing protein [Fodinibius sediminis]|uniref:N terminal of Calcineurin-like phosphoesterase n=1 Tax=Fodinibius sediminis TaxID=1214077 RepID=A0A521CGH0_9BACT|nr:calcineurin-like phosphoesterase family protein [Fodinibius sediminis]SMO58465.1 N terminal of Calcineurin-like phosphoesterase [Fodinibius sediminis]
MNKHFLTLVIVVLLLGASSALAQDMATGIVFHDENQNGQVDSSEQRLAEVPVSNGQEVVLTDKQGRYELPADDDTIIFVIQPDGYKLPVDDKHRPQFYYIHKPEGTPDLDYSGVSPTGPLPDSVNFGLIKGEQTDNFEMLVFGDPQPYNMQEVNYFNRDIVDELVGGDGYEFGITLGDIVGNNLDLFEPYSKSVARIGLPWFNVYGNHDMNFDVESDSLADETFEATFGPPTYAFNKGNVHFIILDDVIYPRKDGEAGYIGGLTDKQLIFIENDLKHVSSDHLIVLAFHIPLSVPRWRGLEEYFRVEDRQKLFNLLSDYSHTLSLSAHTHVQQLHFLDEKQGWRGKKPHLHYNVGTTGGDWWSGEPGEDGIPPTIMRDGTPNGYASIQFEGNDFTLNYKVAGADKEKKMNIWGPDVVPKREWFNADLYVNYFLGSDSTIVEYRVQGKNKWRQMKKVELGDPYITSLRDKWDKSEDLINGKRPNNAVASSHLWKTRIPKNLPEGEHTITIRVTDMFGRQFFDEFSYRVEDR